MNFEDSNSMNENAESKPELTDEVQIVSIPTIEYFERMYGVSLEGNDQKAIGIFKNFETKEKHRRLQHELMMIKTGKVSKQKLNAVVKPKREIKFNGYENWASRMLMWFVEAKV